jgi:ribosomal-protein-serine acetyltransferase
MNPLLIDLPEQIETERLILRSPRAGDGAMVNAAVIESFNELHPWMPWAKRILSDEESEIIQRRSQANFILRQAFNFRLLLRAGGDVVGSCGLQNFHWEVPKCEIGYWLRTKYYGRGLMTEATNAVMSFAFETLKMIRIESETDERNQRSKGVLDRCGFVLEATLRNHMIGVDGSLRNVCVYSRIAENGTSSH